MLDKTQIIQSIVHLGEQLNQNNSGLNLAVNKTYVNNNWLTKANYWKALKYWETTLTKDNLVRFSKNYNFSATSLDVGIIMAGNIPLVGLHDLICVLLSGNKAIIKPSSEDKYVISEVVKCLIDSNSNFSQRIKIVERVSDIDAVIATGSNNSFKYFEYYFKDIPSLLRKNRKSFAVLTGNESDEQLTALADDVFDYFGLGCRNVSLIFLQKEMDITRIIDHFEGYNDYKNHNKFANNYTYHRALLLMNSEQHLDNGFALIKERKDINAPLSCINYCFYEKKDEIEQFIAENRENIQCIVGNYSGISTVDFGKAQNPDIQEFADNKDTLKFLNNLNN